MPGYIAIIDWESPGVVTSGSRGPPPVIRGDFCVYGDARLDNEEELARLLDHAPERGLALLGRAYERWGSRFAARLVGDFAVVVVDLARRVLAAARDPFGVRPLAYRKTKDGIAFASDVGTLCAIEGESSEVDDRSVYDFLTGGERSRTRTFFREVQRLPPGHVLRADRTTTALERYWFPPARVRSERREACLEEFSALFETAVSDRLRTPAPVLAHVSGGLDSSAIACVASALTIRSKAPLHFVSAHFADADESTYVASLRTRLDLPIEVFEAAPGIEVEEPLDRGHPGRYPLAALTAGIASIATRTGARVILSGIGGDELLFERGIYRDLAAQGEWLTLWRETRLAKRYSTRSTTYYLLDALRPRALPRAVGHAVRFARSLRRGRPLPWLRMASPLVDKSAMPDALPNHAWHSHTQRFTWDWLTSPALVATLEAEDRAGAAHGLEMRYPFLDARLASFVLGTAFEHRIPHGRMKALLRDALAGHLPNAIRERTHVTIFDGAIAAAIARKSRFLSDAIELGPWHSERYLDRVAARRALRNFRSAPTDCGAAIAVWDIASLEHWLRAVT